MRESTDRRAIVAALVAGMSLVFAGFGSGCDGGGAIRIGAKPFAEQKILAHAADLLLQARGYDTQPVEICKDTYDCQRRLQSGRIDLMVEYTGTAFRLMGESAPRGRARAFEKLQETYRPLGVEWLAPLGFENSYVWMMSKDRAAALGVDTLGDLASLERPVRVATPAEYVRRSRDGLGATARRYGVELTSEPLVIGDAMARYEAVRNGRADVLVGYSTDGALEAFGMERLEDTLGFFPAYQAALAARSDTLERHAGLRETLEELAGTLDDEAMRDLNYAVDVEGRSPAGVARRFLQNRGVVDFESKARSAVPVVEIAVDPTDGLDRWRSPAVNAVRKVFSDRAVEIVETSDPRQSVYQGRTRLAILGAEEFFVRKPSGENVRTTEADAAAVLGERTLHVIRRRGAGESDTLLPGKVGATRSKGAGDLLRLVGQKSAMRASPKRLLAKLESGELDTVVLLVERGHAAVADALASGSVKLVGFGARHASK